MCFGASSSKSDGGMSSAHKSMHSGKDNSPPVATSKSSSPTNQRPKARPVVRPQARTGNAYLQSTGKRLNPSLFQRVLDTSPTYNAASYLSRRFDPRG